MDRHLLNYARPGLQRELVCDVTADGGVRIVVPTRRGSLGRIAETVMSAHPLAFVFIPIVWLAFKIAAARTPRAVLVLTRQEFRLDETPDDGLGYRITRRNWPRSAIAELRPNRFGPGLYLRVPGRENTDLLTDLPPDQIAVIGRALAEAQERLAASSAPAFEGGGHWSQSSASAS